MDSRFYGLITATSQLTKMVVDAVEFADIHHEALEPLDDRYKDIGTAIKDFERMMQHVLDEEFVAFMNTLKT